MSLTGNSEEANEREMSEARGQVADIPERDTGSVPDRLIDAAPEALDLPCIRCGVCCGIYHVRISKAEACRLATYMGMDLYDWVGRYCEPRWPDPRSYLIRHENGACVFLERQPDERFALCSVYTVRPESCREWAAGPYKPACVEGLRRFWNVTVDDAGRFVGEPDAVARVRQMIREMTR